MSPIAYVDSDWAGDHSDSKSISGFTVMIDGECQVISLGVWVGTTSTFRVVSPSMLTHSDSTRTRVYFQEGKSRGSQTGRNRLSE